MLLCPHTHSFQEYVWRTTGCQTQGQPSGSVQSSDGDKQVDIATQYADGVIKCASIWPRELSVHASFTRAPPDWRGTAWSVTVDSHVLAGAGEHGRLGAAAYLGRSPSALTGDTTRCHHHLLCDPSRWMVGLFPAFLFVCLCAKMPWDHTQWLHHETRVLWSSSCRKYTNSENEGATWDL